VVALRGGELGAGHAVAFAATFAAFAPIAAPDLRVSDARISCAA
jgi:hypothetical protein